MKLSMDRAQAVKAALESYGVDPARLMVLASGNQQMRFPNAQTPSEQQQNMRVEIKVVTR